MVNRNQNLEAEYIHALTSGVSPVSVRRQNNPHSLKSSGATTLGHHYYLPPFIATKAMLCSQCLLPQESGKHIGGN